MGIVSGILDASIGAAERSGAIRITEVSVTIGELTEIVDDALHFAFDALTPGTLAEGATLTVTRVGARSRCGDCGTEYEHGRFDVSCPACGGYAVQLLQGRELSIDGVEIDLPEDGTDPIAQTSDASQE